MIKKKILILNLIFGLIVLTLLNGISAASLVSFDKQVYTYPEQQTIEKDGVICNSGQDFLVRVAPLGCEPAPVRSDLLEENNVLVYCPIQALQLNPAVKIKSIDSISFTGSSYSSEIRGVGFVPSETAKKYGLEQNFMTYQNIGYISVELKRQPNESAMPDFVEGNLTAKISYSSGTTEGIALSTFYVSESLNELENKVVPIFNNKAIVSVEEVSKDNVKLAVHDSFGVKISDLELKEGESSGDLKIPGFSVCDASMKVKIDDIAINPSSRVRLSIDDSNIELTKGEKFLDGKCVVVNINQDSLFRNAEIQCAEDGAKSKTSFILGIQPTVDLNVAGTEFKEAKVGAKLYAFGNDASIPQYHNKNLFLGYIGEDYQGKPVIVIYLSAAKTEQEFLSALSKIQASRYVESFKQQSFFTSAIETIRQNVAFSLGIASFNSGAINAVPVALYYNNNGETQLKELKLQELYNYLFEFLGASENDLLNGIPVKILGFSVPENKLSSGDIFDNYDLAKKAYEQLSLDYPQEKITDSEKTILEEALEKMISLSASVNQNKDLAEFCEEFAFSFPNSNIPQICNENQVSNSETSTREVLVGDSSRTISLVDVVHPEPQDYSADVYIGANNRLLVKDLKYYLSGISGQQNSEYISLTDLTDDTATFQAFVFKDARVKSPSIQTIKIKLGESLTFGNKDYSIRLDKINLKRTAKISVIPQFNKGSSSVPFGFKIGIEKRAIQLSPEKTQEAIEKVNKSIEAFTKISDAMGEGLKVLNGLCYAGQAYMMTRATINLISGEAAARAFVINGVGGWNAFCQGKVDDKTFYSLEDCLLNKSKEIESEVKSYKEGMMKPYAEDSSSSSVTSKLDEVISIDIGEIKSNYRFKVDTIQANLPENLRIESGTLTFATLTQLREIEIYSEMLNTPELKESATRRLTAIKATLEKGYQELTSTVQSINPSSGATSSKIKNPTVKYYEEGDYKGLPALVPVDIQNGIYAAINQEDYISRNLIGFYLGNVGPDGVVDFYSGFDDDKILYVSLDPSINSIARFDTQTNDQITKARLQIENARKAYKSGAKTVTIGGKEIGVEILNVVSSVLQCQNIMSAEECTVLFNLCDPVVCPPSRCDFGGTYRVDNVIQTGIIGSIALCLPNIREGVYIPVCLTGIKAGVDNWNSIQTSYRDCLQTSLDTGETVGICDQIRSVYLCELFYEKAVPLVKSAAPKLISLITKQKASGGGELLFTDSATYIMDSLESLKDTYGTGSRKAFSTKEVTSVEGSFCSNFASTPIPTNFSGFIDFVGKSLESDSPTQYHARFDETKISSVGNPSSHYKVFYHIFAGKNSDVSYTVFLRGESISSNKMVASGTIPAGGYATETKDFTSVPGYKELCISINGVDNCGFKQVSTSFAVDYLTDVYVSEEVGQKVSTKQECISGKIGWHTLLGASLGISPESALSTLADPQIYGFDIIRVCSTDNPGEGTDVARWAEVGNCGSEQLKCWLDTKGVKEMLNSPDLLEAIKSEGKELTSIGEGTMESIENGTLDKLIDEEGYLEDSEDSIKKIRELKLSGKYSEALTLIEETFPKTIMNSQKAELLLLKIECYIGSILYPSYNCDQTFDSDCDGILNGDEESHPEESDLPKCNQDSECEAYNCEYIEKSSDICDRVCYTPKCNSGICQVSEEKRSFTANCEDVKFVDCSSKCNSEKNSCENSCEKDFQQEDPLNGCLVDCSTSLQECINTCS